MSHFNGLTNMKLNILCLFAFACLIVSCKTNDSYSSQFNTGDFKEIFGTPTMEEADLLNPQNITVVDSGILLRDYNAPYFLQYYKNHTDAEPKYFAVKGNGPDEFINTRNIYYNPIHKNLFIYDSQQKRAVYYNVHKKDIVADEDCTHMVILNKCDGHEMAPLKDGYVTNGVFSGKPFARLDREGNLLNTFGSFPVDSTEITDSIAFFLLYQNMIITNPQGTRLAAASYLSDWLSFYNLDNDGNKIKEYYTFPPNVSIKQSDKYTTSVVVNDETLSTYTCLAATEKYFYALFDGRTEKDIKDNKFEYKYVLKFNWNGDFVEGYKMKDRVSCFSVTNDDTKILGIVYSEDGEPSIKEYKIN